MATFHEDEFASPHDQYNPYNSQIDTKPCHRRPIAWIGLKPAIAVNWPFLPVDALKGTDPFVSR